MSWTKSKGNQRNKEGTSFYMSTAQAIQKAHSPLSGLELWMAKCHPLLAALTIA